jgi:hypothetical protein
MISLPAHDAIEGTQTTVRESLSRFSPAGLFYHGTLTARGFWGRENVAEMLAARPRTPVEPANSGALFLGTDPHSAFLI